MTHKKTFGRKLVLTDMPKVNGTPKPKWELRSETLNKSQIAAMLGRLAKGKPKNFTPEEISLRCKRLAHARRVRLQKLGYA